jgi:acyl-CoA synthetase (AMP-forming)/AMP-acid ligase II
VKFNIADLFESAADTVPEREALVAGARRLRYAELDRRANRVAHHLAAAGIGRGDHVGVHAHNCAEWIEVMLGVYKLRAVPINVNYRYVENELRYLFDNADLVGLVFQREFAPRIETVRGAVPKLRHLVAIDDGSGVDAATLGAVDYEAALAAAGEERDFEPRSGDDLYVLYTGGTTGMPKGVVWRNEDVIMALGGGIDHVTRQKAERPEELAAKSQAGAPLTMLPVPPLMHGACQWGTLGSLFVGNKVVLYSERSFAPENVWRLVERERVNVVSITGDAMARPLVEALERGRDDFDLSSLVALASTAALFSPVVKRRFKELLPTLVITDSFGSTEGGFNGTSMYQAEGEGEPSKGLVRVAPGRDTTVLDDEGNEVPPGSGRVGRLARGGNVPLGYYKDPEKTAATFPVVGGRRYAVPGDFATVEADGTIRLLGRGSQCINSGGEKIFPEEVEAALKTHPDVFDSVVVGVPDERWGERVTAVVQPRPGRQPDLTALGAACRKRIAGYKVPKQFVLVDEILRSPSGKPDYPWAKKLALERSSAQDS